VNYAPRGVPAYRGRSYAELERLAGDVRRKIAPAAKVTESLNATSIFEHLDEYRVSVRGTSVALDYAVENLPPTVEAEAKYDPETNKIVVTLSAKTYAELRRGTPRAVFTVAHEIGHAVLHPAELFDRALAPDPRAMQRVIPTHQLYKDTEWQANGFAAALLMPARGLLILEANGADLDGFVISEQFAVSMQAAELRLKTYSTHKRDLLQGRS